MVETNKLTRQNHTRRSCRSRSADDPSRPQRPNLTVTVALLPVASFVPFDEKAMLEITPLCGPQFDTVKKRLSSCFCRALHSMNSLIRAAACRLSRKIWLDQLDKQTFHDHLIRQPLSAFYRVEYTGHFRVGIVFRRFGPEILKRFCLVQVTHFF